jgi:hypothetical protein
MAIGDLRHRKGKAFENQGKSRKHDPIHHGKHEIEMLMA